VKLTADSEGDGERFSCVASCCHQGGRPFLQGPPSTWSRRGGGEGHRDHVDAAVNATSACRRSMRWVDADRSITFTPGALDEAAAFADTDLRHKPAGGYDLRGLAVLLSPTCSSTRLAMS